MTEHDYKINLPALRAYVRELGKVRPNVTQVTDRAWLLAQIHMATKRIEELQNRLDELDGKEKP